MSEPVVDQVEPPTQDEAIAQSEAIAPGEPPTDALVCEADVVQLDLPADQDPFGACLQVAGVHPSGTELVVWLRLTPTTINQLVGELSELLHDQQSALGVRPDIRTRDHLDEPDDHVEPAQDTGGAGESRVRRFLDPMGLRHVRGRSPRSTVMLAAAIAALTMLAFVISLVRG